MLLLGIDCAAVLLPLLVATSGGSGAMRRRDAGLVLAGEGVISLPLVHIALQFLGFVINPRHYVGDYFAMQRDARVAALVIALTLAVGIVAAAAIGATSRPHSRWRWIVGIVETVGAVVFVAIELPSGVQAIADAVSRVGTLPM